MDEHETRPCPYCSELCVRDWAPARGGLARVGPFGCDNCGAVEIHYSNCELLESLESREVRTGWFAPRTNHNG